MVSLIGLAATSGLPVIRDYGPGALLSWSQGIASGNDSNHWSALIGSAGLVIVTTFVAWQAFQRKEL